MDIRQRVALFFYYGYPLSLLYGMFQEILHECILVPVTYRHMSTITHQNHRTLDFPDMIHIDNI